MTQEPLLDGLFKNVYSNKIEDLIPKSNKLQQLIPFAQAAEKIGLQYNQPVMLTDEGGATYNTTAATAQSLAYALNDAIGGVMQNATVNGSELTMRSWLPYRDAARALSGGEQAFASATELIVKNNLKSSRKRVELELLYGGISASSSLGTAASSANVNTTSTNVTFTAASWATGIWSGLINATVQFYYSTATLVSSGADSIFTVTTVTPPSAATSGGVVKFTGTTTGISALDTAISGQTVRVYFNGAYGNECNGLNEIAINSGTLFGISASTYDLWKANTATVSGSLTLGKILSGLALAVGRGMDEDVVQMVNPNTFANLATNEAALRMYDSSYKQSEAMNGSESIVYGSQNGKVEIMPHLFVKGGDSFAFVPDLVKRVGSVDVTFEQPGMGGRIFFNIPAYNGYEFRSYTDQAIFCVGPAKGLLKISGFTNA